ncbi:pyridoxamine 5'-phosphate oxidase family protein [Alkalihalobacillus sp. 1P02AB]|uniref:pyridoxamine 5'-phosphate oxidase family protein n=1 Tax=Alkalihalobacillus sp. 1P02AB TaxID=3132260 RepID=UPI0039A52B26
MERVIFNDLITTSQQLREFSGEPSELVKNKVRDSLDEHCVRFIKQSPFVLVATSNQDGENDVSPRGDGPGFIKVLNNKQLLIPERPGNKRMDSLTNILSNPQIGLLVLIPGLGETLRINGKATIIRDLNYLEMMAVRNKVPEMAIAVEVEECFIHCAKAIKRSSLWKSETWFDKEELPNAAKVLAAHVKKQDYTEENVAKRLKESYENRLY